MASKNKRQREEEAAVWVQRQPIAQQNHVIKHKQRDKGLEVVFDPKAHRWVPSHAPAPPVLHACCTSSARHARSDTHAPGAAFRLLGCAACRRRCLPAS